MSIGFNLDIPSPKSDGILAETPTGLPASKVDIEEAGDPGEEDPIFFITFKTGVGLFSLTLSRSTLERILEVVKTFRSNTK